MGVFDQFKADLVSIGVGIDPRVQGFQVQYEALVEEAKAVLPRLQRAERETRSDRRQDHESETNVAR